MLLFLRKLFIPHYEETDREEVRSMHGVLASSIGLLTNLILVLLKVGLAIYLSIEANWSVFPMALIVDAANNLSDMASCIVVIIGFKVANKPPDEKHPFGHERAEYVAGLIVSFLVLLIAMETIRESIVKIVEAQNVSYDTLSIVLLVIAILIKAFQGYCYYALSKCIHSQTLKASAIDSLSDILATSGVLLAAILAKTLSWGFLDPYIGLFIAILIVVAGIRMMIDNINPLLGNKQDHSLAKDIEKEAMTEKGVLGIHDLIIHSYGPTKKFISFHLEVDQNTSLLSAHKLADTIEHRLQEKEHADVLIHVDPVDTADPEAQSLEAFAQRYAQSISSTISIHDFHLIRGALETKITFDLTLPFSLMKKKEAISEQIISEIKKQNPAYRIYINVDHPFD